MDEAAGRGAPLDPILLEVDTKGPEEIGAVASVVVDQRLARSPGECLQLLALRRLQQQAVRPELTRPDDRTATPELEHQVQCPTRGRERLRVVRRPAACVTERDRDGSRARDGLDGLEDVVRD